MQVSAAKSAALSGLTSVLGIRELSAGLYPRDTPLPHLIDLLTVWTRSWEACLQGPTALNFLDRGAGLTPIQA